MKRQIGILISFIIFSLIGCFIWSFLFCKLPVLLPCAILSFKIAKSFSVFMKLFPTIVCTAFLVGYSISFGKKIEGTKSRFSTKIFEHYKKIILVALFNVFLLTVSSQVIQPKIESYLQYLQKQPVLFVLYVGRAEHYKLFGQDELAYLYIRRATEIYPEEINANRLLHEYEIGSVYKSEDQEKSVHFSETVDLSVPDLLPDSCAELLYFARNAEKVGDWLATHYYASLAERIALPNDKNIEVAKQLAKMAWEKISAVSNTGDLESQLLFAQKMKGYNALVRGDILTAYYIFEDLKITRHISDPDVNRYFLLAEQQLKKQYFFIDEYNDLQKYETLSDLYFTIKHFDGSSEVYFARGVTDIREQGNLIRYLRDFSVVYFDSDGKFLKRLEVPYAKMFSSSTSDFTRFQLDKLNIPEKVKFVPYVLLESVNRYKDRGINSPEYLYGESTSFSEENFLIIPMDFSDIDYIASASKGPQNMDLFSLFQFLPKAASYGYSTEIFNTVLEDRLLYPFSCLILILFFTLMAWNYRLDENVMFKFTWIFVVPFFLCFIHIFIQAIFYVRRLISFSLICLVGYEWCLIVSLVVDLIFFIVLSLLFLSRKS